MWTSAAHDNIYLKNGFYEKDWGTILPDLLKDDDIDYGE